MRALPQRGPAVPRPLNNLLSGHNVPKTQQIDKFAAARFIKRGLGKEEKLANKKQKTDKESSSS